MLNTGVVKTIGAVRGSKQTIGIPTFQFLIYGQLLRLWKHNQMIITNLGFHNTNCVQEVIKERKISAT